MRRDNAFSLIELLLTILIIVLVTALALPALSQAKHLGKQAACANNLHQMGSAVFAYRSDHPRDDVPVGSWPSALLPYLGKDDQAFVCPSGERPPDPIQDAPDLGVYMAGGIIPLVPGPRCWLVDRDSNKPAGWEAGTPPPGVAFEHPAVIDLFEPHPIVDEYEWVFSEQLHHDMDHLNDADRAYVYSDVLLNFNPQGDGTVIVEPRKSTSGQHHQLVDVNTGEILRLMPGPEIVKRYEPLTIGGGVTHYGMNKFMTRTDPNKVLIMDYIKNVADPDDVWEERPIFARHFDQMQTLMGDGSITTFHPGEIDPDFPEIQEAMWGEPNSAP